MKQLFLTQNLKLRPKVRQIMIYSMNYWIKSFFLPGGRSNFIIDNRYPDGGEGEKPTIILRKGKEIEFNVSSFDELTSCLWRGPFSRTKTCQITE